MRVFEGTLELCEPTYFASREVGVLFQTEPVIGNYALAYALGWCAAPYGFRRGGEWNGAPRYREDLTPLNAAQIYVTPATFDGATVRFTVGQFNAQPDSYYFRFGQNSIVVDRHIARPPAMNVPQSGRLRMLGIGCRGTLYVIAGEGEPRLPSYVRLGKFMSKAHIQWRERPAREERSESFSFSSYLNPVDLPTPDALVSFDVVAVPPVPLVRHVTMSGPALVLDANTVLPAGMRFGVEELGRS